VSGCSRMGIVVEMEVDVSCHGRTFYCQCEWIVPGSIVVVVVVVVVVDCCEVNVP